MRDHCFFCGDEHEQTLMLTNFEGRFLCKRCVDRSAEAFAEGRYRDGCDDWFKIERDPVAELYREIAKSPLHRGAAAAIVQISIARAALDGINTLAGLKDTPSDPAEPEPAVDIRPEPKPVAPAGGEATVDRDRHHHEVARNAADAERHGYSERALKVHVTSAGAYVAAYIAARKQLAESAY